MFKIPTIHKPCGGLYGYYLSKDGRRSYGEIVLSKDFEYWDGERPLTGTLFRKCPYCDKAAGFNTLFKFQKGNLERQWDKMVEVGDEH